MACSSFGGPDIPVPSEDEWIRELEVTCTCPCVLADMLVAERRGLQMPTPMQTHRRELFF